MGKIKEKRLNSIRETIELIAKDQINPKSIKIHERRLIVEFLRYDLRYPVRRIAQLLKCQEWGVKQDLKVVNVNVAKELEHGEISSEIIGQIMSQLSSNYDLAMDKRDVSGANKSTELLLKFSQDLGHVTKADDVVNHKGLDILSLALGAGDKE